MNLMTLLGWILLLLGVLGAGALFIVIALPPLGYVVASIAGTYLILKHHGRR